MKHEWFIFNDFFLLGKGAVHKQAMALRVRLTHVSVDWILARLLVLARATEHVLQPTQKHEPL